LFLNFDFNTIKIKYRFVLINNLSNYFTVDGIILPFINGHNIKVYTNTKNIFFKKILAGANYYQNENDGKNQGEIKYIMLPGRIATYNNSGKEKEWFCNYAYAKSLCKK